MNFLRKRVIFRLEEQRGNYTTNETLPQQYLLLPRTYVRRGAMTRRTVFVGDIHIGSGAETNWYQKSVHEPLLRCFLRYLKDNANNIDELVILGDWFDLWNYHPFCAPPTVGLIMEQNHGIFKRQADGGDFISLLDDVKVRFINGDHDMEVELRDINEALSSQTDAKILPGHGSDTEKPALANTYYFKDAVWAEHGHQHDLFNKPALNEENPMSPLPLGYFVARIYCHFLQKKIASLHRMDAACVSGCGNTNYESFGIKLPELVSQLMQQARNDEKFNPAKIILDMMLQYNRNNLLEFKVSGKSLAEVRTDGVARFYPNLITGENFYEALCEAEVVYDGLGHFVREHFLQNPECKVAVMGHTHCPSFNLCGNGKSRVYANPGYFCPSQPDILARRALPGFVEVESMPDGSCKVFQKAVAGSLAEEIVEVASFRVF